MVAPSLTLLAALAVGACGGESIEQTIAVCARGDRDMQSALLQGGTLVFTFRDDGGRVVATEMARADGVSTLPELPGRAATVEVRGLDSGGADVASGTAELTSDGACVCLALGGAEWVCEGAGCTASDDGCEFFAANAPEPCAEVMDGTVLDDSGACFQAGGTPEFLRTEAEGFEDTLRWTHTTDHEAVDNYGLWRVHAAEAARFRIEAYTLAGYGQSRQAVYEVLHGVDITRATVDQSATDGWNEIGVFELAAGGAQSVRLADNTGEPGEDMIRIVFDALRFTRVE